MRLRDGSAVHVRAVVSGSEPYEVKLAVRGDALHVACDCPFAYDHLVCKHVWATLLEATKAGYLSDAERSSGKLRLLSYDEDDLPEPVPVARAAVTRAVVAPAPPAVLRMVEPARWPPPRLTPAVPDWPIAASLLAPREPSGTRAVPAEIVYLVNLLGSAGERSLSIDVVSYALNKKSGVATPKPLNVTPELAERVTDPDDARILSALTGSRTTWGYSQSYGASTFSLARGARDLLAPLLCRTGRCRLRRTYDDPDPPLLSWDEGEPYRLVLEVSITGESEAGEDWAITGVLRRGEVNVPLGAPLLVLEGGLMILGESLARFDDTGAWSWVDLLRRVGRIGVPAKHRTTFLGEVFALPQLPEMQLPEGRALHEETAITPAPCLRVRSPEAAQRGAKGPLPVELAFDYGGLQIASTTAGSRAFDAARWRLVRRAPEAEAAARSRLAELEIRPLPGRLPALPDAAFQIAPARLPAAVRALVAEGWTVTAEGKLYRRPGAFNMSVTSGIDRFDLQGNCDFEGSSVDVEALLEALRRGQTEVVLGDGSLGLLPEEWLSRYGLLAELIRPDHGHLRFKKSQVGLVAALLEGLPETNVDAVFARAREELRTFESIAPADPPATFHGELRGYQREGLGWLGFLRRFGFGGCLADDMGLGKTVQVLALLAERAEQRRAPRKKKGKEPKDARPGPSLVVAPRSLIFNWMNEAARFAPELRLLDHTGAGRRPPGEHFDEIDLVLTTYGTLRRDVAELAKVDFDYAILDEAQAIKNDKSEAAAAVRLLRADHRLALSGTPIENHLGELWSLFEFLNPGLLGRASVFKAATGTPKPETLQVLSRGLRPFLLRRTKSQVAKELPERVDQTMVCELGPAQRALYDDLRKHYRASLGQRVKEQGLSRSKIQVLEALLRLRQAACHLGLVDPTRRKDESAKLEALFAELPSLREKGQKALVFSQFTSLLSIVRERLDAEGVPYEYLDGRTRDREARVERFQTDAECPLFLISLKAGGVGLNLTAAEYVFLLDPWWNPAVEAQAVDRAHRIGQTRSVFAYRLIASGTIEERIADLQQQKKKLAESVIEGDGSLIRELTAEDLELLLS